MSSINANVSELDTWDFDKDVAEFILPRLKHLRGRMEHIPQSYIDIYGMDQEDTAFQKWLKDIDEMIYAWEIIAEMHDDDYRLAIPGLRLFAENVFNLWE
jgi:hypothetical protein